MSSYVVSDNTILLIAGVYVQEVYNPLMITDVHFDNLKNSIDELNNENNLSYNHRYNDKGIQGFDYFKYKEDDGTIDKWLLIDAARNLIKKYSIVEKLKILDCYCYQSNEHDGWESSFAKKITDAARSKLIMQLPEYDNAPWGI